MTSTPDPLRGGVFLDTSGLFAALDRSSDRHSEVAAEFQGLLRDGVPLVTTDAVVMELHGLTLGRRGPAIALEALERILGSPRVRLVATGPGAIRSAVAFLRTRPDRRISLVDALSFAAMHEHELETALAIDSDFVAEGFVTVP